MRNIKETFLTGITALILAAPMMAVESQPAPKKQNNGVSLRIVSKAPYGNMRISKVKRSNETKVQARKKAPQPTTMKPGRSAKGLRASTNADSTSPLVNAD